MSANARLTTLTSQQCWDHVSTSTLGRLVVVVGGEADIFPVNFTHDGRRLYFRTDAGSKLAMLTVNSEVLFEIDHCDHSANTAWSVVVRGEAAKLERTDALQSVEELGLRPWIDSPKCEVVSITPQSISGREFELIPGHT